jgi:biopolymer transport protein ExbD
MARRKRRLEKTDTELNLVPIMNMVMCLIPMVLLGMSMLKVGVLNVSAERFAPTVEPIDEIPLGLVIAVAEDGFRVSAAGDDVSKLLGLPDGEPVLIARRAGAYDHVALYNSLVRIKDHHPKETVVKLTAERDTPFKDLVSAMDVMRTRLAADRFEDLESFQEADVKYEDERVAMLWPDVVFVVAH